MPLTPKYCWSETEDAVDVHVQIPGVSKSAPDILLADCVLKVNAPPYLLLLDLYAEVNEAQSTAKVDTQGITFQLHKRHPGTWHQLLYNGPRHDARSRRDQAIQRAYASQQAQRQQQLELKKQQEKAAQERQWELEKKKRQEIEAAKAAELTSERNSLQQWKQQLCSSSSGAAACNYNAGDESDYEDGMDMEEQQEQAMPHHPAYYGKGQWSSARVEEVANVCVQQQNHSQPASGSSAGSSSNSNSSSAPDAASSSAIWQDSPDSPQQRAASPGSGAPSSPLAGLSSSPPDALHPYQQPATETVPPQATTIMEPRAPPRCRAGPVAIALTPTETEHLPAREQREEEIRVFKRQAASKGKDEDSVDIADRTPAFLKDKGDALYRQGNYSGAVNAYSRALELDEGQAAVWANRGACHLQLGEAAACREDCSRALELMQPQRDRLTAGELAAGDFERARQQVTQVLVRRAAACADLGRLGDAVADYEEALRLDRGNTQLAADMEELRACMRPVGAAALRQRGDSRAKAGDHQGAVEAYSLLLQLPAAQVDADVRQVALANRATCHLMLQQYLQAKDDCNNALQLLLEAAGQPCSMAELRNWVKQQVGGGGGGGAAAAAAAAAAALHLTVWLEKALAVAVLPQQQRQQVAAWTGGASCVC